MIRDLPFLSFRLWRTFYKSLPRHPILVIDLGGKKNTRTKTPFWRQAGVLVLTVIALILIFPVALVLIVSGLFIFIVIVAAGGTAIGLNAAFGIGNSINREQTQGRYHLISVSPEGAVGLSLVLSVRHLRMNDYARRLHSSIFGFYSTAFTILTFGLIAGTIVLATQIDFDLGAGLLLFINAYLVVGLLYVDTVQSAITGALLGIVIPTYTRSQIDTSLSVMVGFLTVQVGIYLVIIAAFLLFGLLPFDGFLGGLILSLLRIGSAMAIREGALHLLWNWTAERLNTDLDELIAIADLHPPGWKSKMPSLK